MLMSCFAALCLGEFLIDRRRPSNFFVAVYSLCVNMGFDDGVVLLYCFDAVGKPFRERF